MTVSDVAVRAMSARARRRSTAMTRGVKVLVILGLPAKAQIVKIMNVTMNVNIDDIHAIYLYNFSVTI